MPEQYTLNQLKDIYLQHLQLKGHSHNSIGQTARTLNLFFHHLREKNITDFKKVDMQTLEGYKGYLKKYRVKQIRPLVGNTIVGRLWSLRLFIRFLVKKGIIYRDITDGWRMPKYKKTLPQGILTQEEIKRIMREPQLTLPLDYRDRTILEVLYSSGIRAGELIRLKVSDVDLEKKLIRITKGKGNKDRFVLLNSQACRFINRYLAKIRPELANAPEPKNPRWKKQAYTGNDRLFLGAHGGSLTEPGLVSLIKRILFRAGIKKKIQPVHGFRHSIATHLLASGMDVRYVQAFLGHETIQSTAIYTHVEKEKLRELLKKYHPREKHINEIAIKRFTNNQHIPIMNNQSKEQKEAAYAHAR
jgi:integrase/recombinase XerD